MEMDWKTNMAELGGAFMVSWLVLSESDMVMMGLLLAATMAAMAGAHVLPMFTWISAMTGDLQDTDAWMGNGMRWLMQIVGAGAAAVLITADGESTYTAGEMWEFDLWTALAMLAAGAVIGAVHSRCEGWMTAFVVVALVGSLGMGFDGAHHMSATLMNDSGGLVDTFSHWAMDGIVIGLGAMLGGLLEEQL